MLHLQFVLYKINPVYMPTKYGPIRQYGFS